jgi:hypothetical protein
MRARVLFHRWEPDGQTANVEVHLPASFDRRSIADWTEQARRLEGRA